LSKQVKRPITKFQQAVGRKAAVRLKNDIEYRGKMAEVDPYMNLILVDAEEFRGEELMANYGRVLVRGNNILFVRFLDEL
jgi:small nuclear ribonucleoprotein